MKTARRAFLVRLMRASAGATFAALAGCKWLEEKEKVLGKASAADSPGGLTGEFNGRRVLAIRAQGELTVFSLVCAHKRCTVKWKPLEQVFECPCHEGKYDATGQVLSGPPPGPLRRYRHEIRNGELWVLNERL